jgi:hypothetical protein
MKLRVKFAKIIVLIPILLVTSVLILSSCSNQILTETIFQTDTYFFTKTQTNYHTQTKTVTQVLADTPLSLRIQYSDSFEIEPSNWTTYSDSDGYAAIKNGALYIKCFTDSKGACDSYPRETFSDFILEVEMTYISGSIINWQSVICRYSNSTYYTFNISADGYYAIYLVDNGKIHTLWEPTYSNYILQGVDTNIIRVECIGNNLGFNVNGNSLVRLMDSTSSSGEVGLALYSMDGIYSEVSFDNFVVYSPY